MRQRTLRAAPTVTVLTVVLALLLAVPGVGHARAEVFAGSGMGCCIEFGLRLTVSIEGTSARGTLELPGPGLGFTDGTSGTELLGVTFATSDVVRWGVPVVRLLAGVAIEYFSTNTSGI